MDLIDRQSAIDKFEPWLKVEGYSEGERNMLKAVLYELTVMPSAQPEIIRCKDCKHRPFDGEDTQGFGIEFPDEMCPCQCDDFWYNWRPDNEWFCANAERRTDGQNSKGI